MLNYEEALTRKLPIPPSARRSTYANGNGSLSRSPSISLPGSPVTDNTIPGSKGYYNTSAHFIWVGDRTRQLDGAHIEYFRGIRNPIGIKVGPSMATDELIRLLDSQFYRYCPCSNSHGWTYSRQSLQRRWKSDTYYALWSSKGRPDVT